ncbi:MAG: SPFH domain-containing protein [Verrucomicrobiota bacterium]
MNYIIASLVIAFALISGYKLVLRVFGVVIIGQDSLGIVNKKWVLFGANKTLPDGEIIALKGEAGWQADTLSPGVHFWLFPWQYTIKTESFYTVPNGELGTVVSKAGAAITNGRVLAKEVGCKSFQDARAFLENGGERGPQIAIIPPGTYRINTEVFEVNNVPVKEIADNMVGIITTKEGRALGSGDIAGREIPDHSMYQNAQAFLDNGGFKGLQEQVLLAGRYFINPLFATVESKPMTDVPIAYAGVVIAYVGEKGVDLTGAGFKHGNLVSRGQKGVWADPLDPGKYPINPYTHKVENVPTANVVLNWANDKSEAHKLDEKLSTITVRSSDGFTFNLDVSQIIHIPRNDAPKVIARFGSVSNLVTQVLEPTIGNYFRNAAQGSDVIDFLKQRQQRQDDAKLSIGAALGEYNVGAVDTLIGDIIPPAELMKTLTDRKIAEQERTTYDTQRIAEEARKELQQARAIAETQPRVVDAERSVSIAEFAAHAAIKSAEGQAKAKTINAEADARVLVLVGNAEGGKITAVGTAEADVIQKKTTAIGQGNYATIESIRALAAAGINLVPQIVAGGGAGGNETSLLNVLLGTILAREVGGDKTVKVGSPVSEEKPVG